MKEVFKDIPGYEGKYQASNLGNIKSLNYRGFKQVGILKQSTQKTGYKMVSLGKHNNYLVHRLIAITFIKNIDCKPWINHKDGNKDNNSVINLEWCTPSENELHSYKKLNKKNNAYGKYGGLHPVSKAVKQFNIFGEYIKTWDSITEASMFLKVHGSGISHCIKGKQRTAYGFIWKLI